MASPRILAHLQYATDFQALTLTRPNELKPLDVLRKHAGRSTKVTDVLWYRSLLVEI